MPIPVRPVTIFIDGSPYETSTGQSLLRACLTLGFDVPYFCWHPALESVGACRQCAVKLFRDEKDTRGRIVMSCMTPVTDGLRLSVDDPEARQFRAANIEWLMLNHPHDCPVCDEGGECHLQDMTVLTGHVYRRTRFGKRTHRNQFLGPFLNHEMNRCIQCYRCVRFYRDYAGGRDLGVFGSGDRVYFGRHEDGILESVFSGNLAEVCPTGVFTDKTAREHYVRPWDLETAPSVCVHCGLGCNTIPGARYGKVRRIRNRYNGDVNGYFLCDRGRYGYGFVNHQLRIRTPLVRQSKGSPMEPVTAESARARLREILSRARGVVGIGSSRASLEDNFALRALVGPDRFFAGTPGREMGLLSLIIDIMRIGPFPTPSLKAASEADAALIIGEDITNTAPMLALAVRQALRRSPMAVAERLGIPLWDDRAVREASYGITGDLFIASSAPTILDTQATATFRRTPEDAARLAFAAAHLLDHTSPEPAGLGEEEGKSALSLAEALKRAERPLIIAGVSAGSRAVIQGAANLALALFRSGRAPGLSFVVHECNAMGLALMYPQGVEGAIEAVEKGEADTMIIMEHDLFRTVERGRLNACLARCRHVVLLDQISHETASRADLTLPAATFAETSGTLVSSEGRGQRFFEVLLPEGPVQAGWRWINDVMVSSEEDSVRRNLDDVIAALIRTLPVFAPIRDAAPDAGFRIRGRRIPRQAYRASGRTSMFAHKNIHEPKPADDPDAPFAFSMEGYEGKPPPALLSRYWAPGWNSVQGLNKFQVEVGGPLSGGDPGKRLIEPEAGKEGAYFTGVPEPSAQPASLFRVTPLFHIFGSEELSALSPPIAERIPAPYIAVNPEDGARLGLLPGDKAEVLGEGGVLLIPVSFMDGLPPGTAGIPVGLPELPRSEYIEVRKVRDE